jgi:hypothetical protein
VDYIGQTGPVSDDAKVEFSQTLVDNITKFESQIVVLANASRNDNGTTNRGWFMWIQEIENGLRSDLKAGHGIAAGQVSETKAGIGQKNLLKLI